MRIAVAATGLILVAGFGLASTATTASAQTLPARVVLAGDDWKDGGDEWDDKGDGFGKGHGCHSGHCGEFHGCGGGGGGGWWNTCRGWGPGLGGRGPHTGGGAMAKVTVRK
ncbi:hypothetical protein AB0B45_07485 [Nonomuraea sp. NPDC049152]|uniref:hypothetical protein n=1 Tax=Nonomuraea sp. NPDC049152 TaxID=3154350 RepID=UPI0033EEAE81